MWASQELFPSKNVIYPPISTAELTIKEYSTILQAVTMYYKVMSSSAVIVSLVLLLSVTIVVGIEGE